MPTISEALLCPCWTEPGTGEPQRCAAQSKFGPAFPHPGCAEERPQADGQQTLGSFQTRSGPWPPRASAACPSPLSLPPCPSHRWCWPSLRRPQHADLSPGWMEFRNPSTEEWRNVGTQLEARMWKQSVCWESDWALCVYLFILPPANDSIETVESTRCDKQDVCCVYLHRFTSQLPGVFLRNIDNCALQEFQ